MTETENIKGGSFIKLALGTWLCLYMEFLWMMLVIGFLFIKHLLTGRASHEFTPGYFTTGHFITHWLGTSVIWGAFIYLIIRKTENKYKFCIMDIGKEKEISAARWILAVVLTGVSIIDNAIGWGTLKILGEYALKENALLFIFQYIYYFFEVMLMMLIIGLGQQAGEKWFQNANVPWGGILLGLTWGLGHSITKMDITMGISCLIFGVIYGIIYLLLHKKFVPSYFFILLAFVF